MKIFLICPVRGLSSEERTSIQIYVNILESAGHKIHWPPRDTDQDDPVGLRILHDNTQAIADSEEVHIWWNTDSRGSLFDLGVTFALKKKLVLANPESVLPTEGKSFNNVLLQLHGGER